MDHSFREKLKNKNLKNLSQQAEREGSVVRLKQSDLNEKSN